MDIASVLDDGAKLSSIYLPPKEIISTTENFSALYEDYHIAFEETYYDLSKLLARPLRKGPNTKEQNAVLDKFGMLMGGLIVQRENKFYLKVAGEGEFEMGLVSEGYRKLATIVYLIQNGSLGSDTVLFWDEPETNMNPKMILPLVEAIVELARMGVQIFLTTHDYFVQQYVNLQAVYGGTNRQADILFTSLYRDESGRIGVEQATNLSDLTHNTIMEEFDSIYDREQGLIYEGIRKQD